MSIDGMDDSGSSSDPLELTSLDSESLFRALSAVEASIPDLIVSIKPILHHLVAPPSSQTAKDEQSGIEARDAVEKYMALLDVRSSASTLYNTFYDKIQFVLRQTVYYLLETKGPPQTLNPPAINAIPTPFASTLPSSTAPETSQGSDPELGLYATRLEARFLGEMLEALRRLKDERESKVDERGRDMSVDPQPP